MSKEVEENQKPSLAKRVFIGVLLTGFLVMGFISLQRALPEAKEERIYNAIKAYSPYVYEKRLGGLTIVDTRDNTKEKPSASETLFRMDELDKKWAQEYIVVDNNELIITKDDNTTVQVLIQTPKERAFVKSFFGI